MKHPKFNTTPEVSERMSNVKLKRGTAETMLGKALWKNGIRYRYNLRSLPGSPDIVIAKYRIVIFIDGEFWHGKDWAKRKKKLKTNRKYWIEKIEENIARDRRNDQLLKSLGWTVIHFWESEILKHLERCSKKVIARIQKSSFLS